MRIATNGYGLAGGDTHRLATMGYDLSAVGAALVATLRYGPQARVTQLRTGAQAMVAVLRRAPQALVTTLRRLPMADIHVGDLFDTVVLITSPAPNTKPGTAPTVTATLVPPSGSSSSCTVAASAGDDTTLGYGFRITSPALAVAGNHRIDITVSGSVAGVEPVAFFVKAATTE